MEYIICTFACIISICVSCQQSQLGIGTMANMVQPKTLELLLSFREGFGDGQERDILRLLGVTH